MNELRDDRRRSRIIALIPAYNEERTIAKIILKTKKYVDKVIVCDDGSTDMTGEIAEALGAEVIRHEKNMGKGVALRSLFTRARELDPDIVVVLDADGQHNPEDIPKLINALRERNADIVIGSRYVKGSQLEAPLYRKLGLSILNFLGRRLIKSPIKDIQSGFRALTIKALKSLEEVESRGFGIESEQIALAVSKGLKIVEIPIIIKYRGLDKTSKKMPLLHGGEVIVTILKLVVEERPLLYLGVPGILLLITGIALSTYLLWLFNMNRYFSIPIAIITLGAVFTGLMLIVSALTLYGLNKVARKILLSLK